jgi:hypothetical protein
VILKTVIDKERITLSSLIDGTFQYAKQKKESRGEKPLHVFIEPFLQAVGRSPSNNVRYRTSTKLNPVIPSFRYDQIIAIQGNDVFLVSFDRAAQFIFIIFIEVQIRVELKLIFSGRREDLNIN